MTTRNKAAAGTLAICGLLGTIASAAAQDFTVTVPVDLTNMPAQINAVVVECAAICGNPFLFQSGDSNPFEFTASRVQDIPSVLSNPDVVGSGRQVRAVNTATGEFHQNVTVSFSASGGKTPNHVGAYSCWMILRDVNGQEAIPSGDEGQVDEQFLPADQQFASEVGGLSGIGFQTAWFSRGNFNNPALQSLQGDQPNCNG